METKYFQTTKKRRLRRGIGILLAVVMIFLDGTTVSALEQQDTVVLFRSHIKLTAGQAFLRSTNTTGIILSKEEQENNEEGWSWKKDKDNPLSYTLTLDNADFQVSGNSAIQLYADNGFPIQNINIVLKGENQLVSTTVLNNSNGYQCNGIYFSVDASYPNSRKPVVSITGDGSLKAEGTRCGMVIQGALRADGITIDARNGISVSEELSVSNSNIKSNTISAGYLYVDKSEITVALDAKTQGGSLIWTGNADISESRLELTGYHDEPTYSAIGCTDNSTVNIKDSFLAVRNVEFGIRSSYSGSTGKISLDGVTGTLFCTNDWYSHDNSVFFCDTLEVVDSEIFAQSGKNILIYGDCTLPEEIKEFTVEGDLRIQGGKTFTIGEDQKVNFTKNWTKVSNPYYEQVKLINHGTLHFQYRPEFSTNAFLENKGTLIAEDGLNCQSIDQFTNDGTYNGAVYLDSGVVKYYYGNVTQQWNVTVGVNHWFDSKIFVMSGAALTIPDGKTLDATQNGVSMSNLHQCLSVEGGGKIILEEEGTLLLPAGITEEQLDGLHLSGKGTVKIGDSALHKVTCMDGSMLLSSGFAGGDNMAPQPALPVKDGYIFRGWYTEEGTAFDFNIPIDTDLTLYARWELLPVDVALQAGSSVSLKGDAVLTYGQELSKLEFNPAVFVEPETNMEVSGILRWKNPSDTPKAGSKLAEWVFMPDNREKYQELTGTVVITVRKATPEAGKPTVNAITYNPSVSLSSLEFKGGIGEQRGVWNWKDGTIVPTVGNSGYTAVFTPADTANYNSVEATISISVKPAENAPGMPSATLKVKNSCRKVSDVELPEGWNWQAADQDTALQVGKTVKATAVYTGADKGNYINESVVVRINRQAAGSNKPSAITGVSIDKGEVTLTKAGETVRLTASVTPADNANQKVTWTSSNPKVASVDAEGKVTAVGDGNCIITATTQDGSRSASCKLTVMIENQGITDTPEPDTSPEPDVPEVSPTPDILPTPHATAVPRDPGAVRKKNALSLNAKFRVSQTGKKINITWGKVAGAEGYHVYVQYCGKKFNPKAGKCVTNGKTTSLMLAEVNGRKLDLKKNYKIYVTAYKLADGKKVTLGKSIIAHIVGRKNTKYTNVKAVKVEKSSYRLKVGSTAQVKASTIMVSRGKKQLTDAHAKKFRYASSNQKIAAVSGKGRIKAVKKGSCIIYVYARNGYTKKIKVTVKQA